MQCSQKHPSSLCAAHDPSHSQPSPPLSFANVTISLPCVPLAGLPMALSISRDPSSGPWIVPKPQALRKTNWKGKWPPRPTWVVRIKVQNAANLTTKQKEQEQGVGKKNKGYRCANSHLETTEGIKTVR